jgi:DNA-binding transcriptional ArsR family regulator
VEQNEIINAAPLELSASMAKPLANPWRNRILGELNLRSMSPKRFVLDFVRSDPKGPELSTIARYFRELEKWGLIEVAQELRGGKRRGAVEKVYRLAKRIHFDTPTWERLPYYLRSECSASLLKNLFSRIDDAVESGTFDQEKDRHLSWKAIRLDRPAWSQLSTRLDEVLALQYELEAEADHRKSATDASGFVATTGLLSFRSPSAPLKMDQPGDVQSLESKAGDEGQHFIMKAETAKALADPWRNSILAELNLQPMSPKHFFEEFGGPDFPTVARHFRQLKNWGYLEVAEELRGGRRRGSVEKIYKAATRVRFSTPTWEHLSWQARNALSITTLDALYRRIDQAMAAGTFDVETDRFLAWKTGYFDDQAWARLAKELDDVLDFVEKLELESAQRLSERGEQIFATIGLLSFRSPNDSRC